MIQTGKQRIHPKLVALTPYEIYVQQVRGAYDAIRSARRGLDYIPPQMGGFFGQREVANSSVVLELTEFEIY